MSKLSLDTQLRAETGVSARDPRHVGYTKKNPDIDRGFPLAFDTFQECIKFDEAGNGRLSAARKINLLRWQQNIELTAGQLFFIVPFAFNPNPATMG